MSVRKMNTLRRAIVGGFVLFALFSGYEIFKQMERRERLREQIASAEQDLEQAAFRRYEFKKIALEVEDLRAELVRRRAEVEEAMRAEKGVRLDGYTEGLVGEWFDRIRSLDAFVRRRQDLCIPEMKLLTPKDWLDACNLEGLDSEADFRLALSELRLLAKRRVAPRISEGFSQYAEEEMSELSVEAFLQGSYLDESLDPGILKRFQLKEPDDERPVRFGGKWKLVEESKVDDVWHTTLFVGPNKSFGYSRFLSSLESFENAMADFEREEGRVASSGRDLLPYLKNTHEKEHIEEIYRAVNTRVDLP